VQRVPHPAATPEQEERQKLQQQQLRTMVESMRQWLERQVLLLLLLLELQALWP
jgi:hypothetical protein